MNSVFKKPKIEEEEDAYESGSRSDSEKSENEEEVGFTSKQEQEETLVAIIEHRDVEVELLKKRVSYYHNLIAEAEKRKQDAVSKLARLRGRTKDDSSEITVAANGPKSLIGIPDLWNVGGRTKIVKEEPASPGPVPLAGEAPRKLSQSKPELLIPSLTPKVPESARSEENGNHKTRIGRASQASVCDTVDPVTILSAEIPNAKIPIAKKPRAEKSKAEKPKPEKPKAERPNQEKPRGEKPRIEKPQIVLDWEVAETQDRGTKRKLEQKRYDELIQLLGRSSARTTFECHTDNLIPSQHKRRMRSLVLSPVDDELFVTSALDGLVNLWQLQSDGSTASLLTSSDFVSPKKRRWPEDVAWHPRKNSLFSVYAADGGDAQISMLSLNKTQGRSRLIFLEGKPHSKGNINRIMFLPWQETSFVTGGNDHAVFLWREGDESLWDPELLHKNLHSSAVMGVAGMQHKSIVLSSGADKRLVGYNVQEERSEFKYQLDSKCMNVLPNPHDLNLFMVQTGQLEKQLRLYDIRLPQTELHSFGWKQESSESQSALINQSWSPDGLCISSGSVDPVIHIFDIRYNANKPSQSIRSHQKRVFKAEWHSTLPLLISISSDLNIGLHKIS